MQPFVYDALPGRVVFANGAFDRIPDELRRLGVSRVLLIADRSGATWANRLAEALGANLVGRIDDVRVHVPIERARAARALAVESAVDVVVTIGGGSATGLGKAVALEIPVPILAVPTTYAGSEMTPIWGLTEGARKTTGRDPQVQPRTVVYDPVLTLSLPPSVAGPSGMNALAHCAEALYADGASPIPSLMAEQGIRILATGLPRVVAAPDDGRNLASRGAGRRRRCCGAGAHSVGGAEVRLVDRDAPQEVKDVVRGTLEVRDAERVRGRVSGDQEAVDREEQRDAEVLLAQNPKIIGLGVYIWNVAPATE